MTPLDEEILHFREELRKVLGWERPDYYFRANNRSVGSARGYELRATRVMSLDTDHVCVYRYLMPNEDVWHVYVGNLNATYIKRTLQEAVDHVRRNLNQTANAFGLI